MAQVVITKLDNGPFLVKGDVQVVDAKGNAYETGETVALCRCGHSKKMPFCDGSHQACGFKEESRAK